jgi:hypothetical protein
VDLFPVDEREFESAFFVVCLVYPHGCDRFVAVVGPVPSVEGASLEVEFGADLAYPVGGEEEKEYLVARVAPGAVQYACAPGAGGRALR